MSLVKAKPTNSQLWRGLLRVKIVFFSMENPLWLEIASYSFLGRYLIGGNVSDPAIPIAL
jgi:hypothetical protein